MSKRKRSATVGFSALTLSAATVLSGCEQPASRQAQAPTPAAAAEEAPLYASVEQCRAENPGIDCDAAFKEAQAQHAATAPQFASQAECEQAWGEGQCGQNTAHAGGGIFMPLMMGFLLGRALSGPRAHPVYGNRSGGLYSGRNYVGQADLRGGRYGLPGRLPVSNAPGGGVQRGGFGTSAYGRGAVGG
ncbi:MAG TPA: DUF1190 domain-containing protein [Caulobacteraceae bacterium]|nr:DUF1190 domain-containing protein [Caulobacteraceae bacterium]